MSMPHPLRLSVACAAVIAATASSSVAQYTTPNVVTGFSPVSVTLGDTTFTNHGLQGVGRVSASLFDAFSESFGSVSGMQITGWSKDSQTGAYSGVFNTLPDRGFNDGLVYDYAARLQQLSFTFTPYTSALGIGGITEVDKMAAQNQIAITYTGGTKLTYNGGTQTTSQNPNSTTALFGGTMPFVTNDGANAINKFSIDSEALVLFADGSGYIGDEYGSNVYYFNASKEIVGAIAPPAAIQPHSPATTLNFNGGITPVNGRRNNQGFEGISTSPDGTKLFVLAQSATVQDSPGGQQNRRNTRLLVYTISPGNPTPTTPSAEYALTLPTFTFNGNNGAVDRTAAQSEVIALDDHRLLVLSRDGNGLGAAGQEVPVFKSVLLVDLNAGPAPTDLLTLLGVDGEGERITAGATADLKPGITPISWVQAINMLNSEQLAKFNINLDTSAAGVNKLTLSEKWEGMALVPALDPANPNDWFLFVANDNDFQSDAGQMKTSGSATPVAFDGTATDPQNDTMFLAYRVTIAPVPEPGSALLLGFGAAALAGLRRRRG